MYKINFYPEYFEKRRAAKRLILSMAFTSLLLGLVALQIVSLVLSIGLLHEQAQTLRASLPRLSVNITKGSETEPEVQVAYEMLKIRSRRTDWAPKLAALSDQIEPTLKLVSVEGMSAVKDSPSRFELTGQIRSKNAKLEEVSGFIKAIQNDPRITDELSDIRLGNLKEGGASEFLLICKSRSDES